MRDNPYMNEGYRLADSDADHVKAVAFNMLFMVWRRRTLSEAYRHGIRLVRELATQFPEGVGVCQVVEVDALPPDNDARAAFVEFLKLDTVKHFSVIHDGTGFKAASVRAIIAAVHALGRPKFKHAVHSTVDEAAGWHALAQAELGHREGAVQIAKIVRSLRAFHVDRYPA